MYREYKYKPLKNIHLVCNPFKGVGGLFVTVMCDWNVTLVNLAQDLHREPYPDPFEILLEWLWACWRVGAIWAKCYMNMLVSFYGIHNTEAKCLNIIQTKVLRVFLCSFALDFYFFQLTQPLTYFFKLTQPLAYFFKLTQHLTCFYSLVRQLLYTVKERGGKSDWKP